ncbi:hypothetical protein HanIR_Chr01g0026081 [Helianthus annuus]|nr:hypothetical protein HanIR_Chr01g0026081 [Helianthus annuus]
MLCFQFGPGLFSFGLDKPRSTSVSVHLTQSRVSGPASVLVRFKVRIGVSWTSSENISFLLLGITSAYQTFSLVTTVVTSSRDINSGWVVLIMFLFGLVLSNEDNVVVCSVQ